MAIKKFSEVTVESLQVYLDALVPPTFSFQEFFPLRYTSSLTWESLEVDGELSVSADVISHDAGANLKSRPDTKTAMGEIPKIAVLNRVGERTMHDYFALLNSQSSAGQKEIYRIIFGDVRRGYEGIHMRMEHLAMQALSTGVAETTASNNEGIPFKATYSVPSANKTGVAVVWSSSSTAKPIDDLSNAVEAMRAKGIVPGRILMRRDTFNQLRNCDSVKALYSGRLGLNAGTLRPTIDNINVVLEAEGLPPIRLIETSVNLENKAGTITSVNPWSANKVAIVPAGPIGSVQWTNTAEEKGGADLAAKNSIAVNRDIVRISRYNKFDPFRVFTKGETVAWPVINGTKNLFLINTNNVTTWS
jgi:hypothetical protein